MGDKEPKPTLDQRTVINPDDFADLAMELADDAAKRVVAGMSGTTKVEQPERKPDSAQRRGRGAGGKLAAGRARSGVAHGTRRNRSGVTSTGADELIAILQAANRGESIPDAAVASSVSPETAKGDEKENSHSWTEERLWQMVPDGAAFTITSPDKKQKEGYQRKGNTVVPPLWRAPLPTASIESILTKLNDTQGPWQFELFVMGNTKSEQEILAEESKLRLPEPSGTLYYQSKGFPGKEITVYCQGPDQYVYRERTDSQNPTDYSPVLTRAEIWEMLENEKWEVAGEMKGPALREASLTSQAQEKNEADPYKIEEGQTWIREINMDGKLIPETLQILKVSTDGMVVIKRKVNGDEFGAPDAKDLEEVQEELREGAYTLADTEQSADVPLPVSRPEPNPELLKGRDPRDYRQVLPGDVWVLRAPSGEVLDRLTVNQILSYKSKLGDVVNATSEWEKSVLSADALDMESLDQDTSRSREWPQEEFRKKLALEGYQLEVAGTEVVLLPSEPKSLDHHNETDPYATIEEGDQWGLWDEQGQLLEQIEVRGFVKKRFSKKELVLLEYAYPNSTQKKTAKLSVAEFQAFLRKEGYLLIQRGAGDFEGEGFKELSDKPDKPKEDILQLEKADTRSVNYKSDNGEIAVERDPATGLYLVTAVVGGAVIGKYAEENIRRLAKLQNWEYLSAENKEPKPSPEPIPPSVESPLPSPELMGPPKFDEPLEQAKAAVSQTRADFIRLEAEQKGAWTKLMNFFRTSAGKASEMSPEVSEAMEQYKGALTRLLNLEIENLKRSNLKGEELRRAMADLVREFDFVHGEEEDEERRKARLGEGGAQTLKEKWKKVWTQTQMAAMTGHEADGLRIFGAFLEASGATVYRAGIQYNRLTDTKTKKIAMAVAGGALASVVIFSGGGAAAATAGLCLGLKRLGAAAGGAVAVKGLGDALAQAGRERRALRNAEEAISELQLTQKDEVEQSVMSQDTATTDALEATLSEEKAREFENLIQQSAIENLAVRGAKRRMGRLWRNTAAGVAGGALAWAVPGTMAHAAEAAQNAIDGSSAASRVAGRLADAASAPSPAAAAASAAEASASAPGGASSSPSGTGGPGTPSTSPPNIELPKSSNPQSSELLNEKVIARGDTIWKYATGAAEAAGIESKVDQQRFAALLRNALNEKLASMSPEAAKAAGFIPGPDGKFSADRIGAGKTLKLSAVLTQDEMAKLFEQAESSVSTGAEKALEQVAPQPSSSQVIDAVASNKTYPADIVLEETAKAANVDTVQTNTTPDFLGEFIQARGLNDYRGINMAMVEYIQSQPREVQIQVARNIKRCLQYIFEIPGIPGLGQQPELLKTSAARVLADYATIQETVKNRSVFIQGGGDYDQTLDRLHWRQMERVTNLHDRAALVLGADIARPIAVARGESVQDYVRRLAIFAQAKGISAERIGMVN